MTDQQQQQQGPSDHHAMPIIVNLGDIERLETIDRMKGSASPEQRAAVIRDAINAETHQLQQQREELTNVLRDMRRCFEPEPEGTMHAAIRRDVCRHADDLLARLSNTTPQEPRP